jgi:Transposase DDE domain/Transposase domain (DUF772)
LGLAFLVGFCENLGVTFGVTPVQADLFLGSGGLVGGRVGPGSIWSVLHREGHRLFPDELFADLFSDRGRRSVPPQIVATVMVLQRLYGKSDREAVEAFEFDTRWKYACGVDINFGGFAHTVLVEMRARLARSDSPKRIFEVTLEAARGAGLVGARRVLDSTPLYDAVATMDTVTLLRSAMIELLDAAETVLRAELRAVMVSGDEYVSNAKPQIDWDSRDAREVLIDSHARDGHACLALLHERTLTIKVCEAAVLLASLLGQDLVQGEDGVFRIARKVARDRIISTVDPDARHGHKTAAKGFDGYKGHVAADPDSEIITATAVTPGNAGDGSVAEKLIEDLLNDADRGGDAEVFGDAAYGTGSFQNVLENNQIISGCKTQSVARRANGLFTKDRFVVDLDAGNVTCPNQVTVLIGRHDDGSGTAKFGPVCATCPLRAQCTSSKSGRTISIHTYEAELVRARARNQDSVWRARYRATRPKIERKLGHLMRRKHGGRNARVRGRTKIDADFSLLAAAVNLARLAFKGLTATRTGWTTAT